MYTNPLTVCQMYSAGMCIMSTITITELVFISKDDPLNSEDDDSDDGATDLFDTENVVVCQFDKVKYNTTS